LRVLDDGFRRAEQLKEGDGVVGGCHSGPQPVIELETIERRSVTEMEGRESSAAFPTPTESVQPVGAAGDGSGRPTSRLQRGRRPRIR
jgi:hypothetical protein